MIATAVMAVRHDMADIQFDDSYDLGHSSPAQDSSGKFAKMANTTGAVISVALILGIGVWGYRLLVRDVSGIPVVQAIDGPMRVTPKDPGGQLATHQGLSVNRLQTQESVHGAVQSVQLAPEPIGVIESDIAGIGKRNTVSPADQDTSGVQLVTSRAPSIVAPTLLGREASTAEEPANTATAKLSTSEEIAAALALADQIASGATPLSDVPPAPNLPVPNTVPNVVPTPSIKIVSADIAGVVRSPRPLVRPASLDTAVSRPVSTQSTSLEGASSTTSSNIVVASVAPSDIAVGTRLAQLGAFDSRAIAEKEWLRLSGRFDEFMDGKKRVIQKAESGGRVFYRLRAFGFRDLSEARRFCAALMAEQAACIPVKVR